MPPEQTYQTHRRIVPAYHGVAFLLITVYLGFAVWQLVKTPGVATVMPILLAVAVVLIFWYARLFALTAQDRVIRLEEQLRLQRLLPSDLHPRIAELTPAQLIALRFASDEELPDLTRTVLDQRIEDREAIKRMVKHWRPDDLRV